MNITKSTIIQECLNAVVNGPFIDDMEFSTLFGLSRAEVNEILVHWPNVNMQEEAVRVAISNSFNNLIGYPIDCPEKWPEYLSVTREQLVKMFDEWRVEVYGPV